MTIGEKIQFHRKKNGMSQEELGQKLLVSRQTISLWETGQTLPTIDNLIRLREIFGVSIDEIICEEQESESEIQLPLEAYKFTYSAEEIEIFDKYSLASLKESWKIIAVLLFASFFFVTSDASEVLVGLSIGFLIAIVLGVVKSYFLQKNLLKKSKLQMLKSEYSYDFFSDYFIVRISRENTIIKLFNVQYTEIENLCDIGNFFAFEFNGQLFFIKKTDLKENSVLLDLFNKRAKKQFLDSKTKKLDIVSWVLVWGSALSVYIAPQIATALSEFNGKTVENMWVFFLFLPITIGSVIFGYKARLQKTKTTKNIVVGIIMTIIVFLFGMFCVFFNGQFDYDNTVIEKVESCVGVDIPEPSHVMTQDWTENTNGETLGGMYYSSDVTFSEIVAEDFEKQLALSEKWASDLPTEFRGLFPVMYSSADPDYYLLYNIDLKELNTVPAETGVYRFLAVIYSTESNSMRIIEYDVNYVK